MSSDRLKRYVAAVDHVLISVAAKAAMAVADAEIQLHVEATKYWFDAADERRDENARLRAELVESRRRSMDSGKEVTRLHAELREANATIERVRAVLDLRERLDDPVSRYIAAELRAALEGGTGD